MKNKSSHFKQYSSHFPQNENKPKENYIEKYLNKGVVSRLKGILSQNQNYQNAKSYKKP